MRIYTGTWASMDEVILYNKSGTAFFLPNFDKKPDYIGYHGSQAYKNARELTKYELLKYKRYIDKIACIK